MNKKAGTSCKHLTTHHECEIHDQLKELHYSGCMNYDCFGAGQKVAQAYFPQGGEAHQMYDVFTKTYALYELLWYLEDALHYSSPALVDELRVVQGIVLATLQTKAHVLQADLMELRSMVNPLLRKSVTCTANPQKQFLGYHFKNKNMMHTDFSNALLLGAKAMHCNFKGSNFIGADVRQMDVRGADLREVRFLTQAQLNAMIGNQQTKLPLHFQYPSTWE